MCQMCDEYENELVRMGLIADARKFREEREAAHAEAAQRTQVDAQRPAKAADAWEVERSGS